jgi:hypothetical protein
MFTTNSLRALITCYQSIMIEMASDLHATRTLRDDHIANLRGGDEANASLQAWCRTYLQDLLTV